jgi:hypothetical protein
MSKSGPNIAPSILLEHPYNYGALATMAATQAAMLPPERADVRTPQARMLSDPTVVVPTLHDETALVAHGVRQVVSRGARTAQARTRQPRPLQRPEPLAAPVRRHAERRTHLDGPRARFEQGEPNVPFSVRVVR